MIGTLVRRAAPPRPRHPLRAEAVRGFAPWAGAAVLLTLAVALAGIADRWQGDWAETQARIHSTAALLGAPLAAAAGCWQGGRERRRGTEELGATAARTPLARFLASALPVAAWVAAGYAAATAGALLAGWPYASGGRPLMAPLLADAVLLGACALAGQVVGRLVAWRLAAPALAVSGYVGFAVSAYAPSGAARYLSPAATAPDVHLPVWWQPLATAVWTGGLGVAAVLAYASRRRAVALVPLAAAATAAVLIVHTGPGLWHENPLARRQMCDTSTTPAICVNARQQGLLPQVVSALSGVTGRLDGVRNLPVRFEDLPGEPKRDEVQLPMLDPVGWSVVRGQLTDPGRYAWEAARQLVTRDCRKDDPRVARTDDVVADWLAAEPAQEYFDELLAEGTEADRAALGAERKARTRLASMGEAERRAWLSHYFATARGCDLGEVPAL